MKCSILVLYRLVIGTVLYFVSAWVVYYWFVIGRLRVRLACAKTTKSSGKSNRFLILIYCGEYSLLKIATKSDLKAAVNEIHDATVVFELNSLASRCDFHCTDLHRQKSWKIGKRLLYCDRLVIRSKYYFKLTHDDNQKET